MTSMLNFTIPLNTTWAHLDRNPLHHVIAGVLKNLPDLRAIRLHGCEISHIDDYAFVGKQLHAKILSPVSIGSSLVDGGLS